MEPTCFAVEYAPLMVRITGIFRATPAGEVSILTITDWVGPLLTPQSVLSAKALI
jgi:hypothetical protein